MHSWSRKLALALFALPFGMSPAFASQDSNTGDLKSVEALYGNTLSFDVYRNGDLVGYQNVTFSRRNDELAVDIDFKLTIKALYITFYEMTYRSDSLWRNDELVALDARTDQNGKVTTVKAKAEGGKLEVDGPNGKASAPLGIYPTDHWNAGVIDSTRLVNTINGHINHVRLVKQGEDKVETERGPVEATHYKYTGEIQNDVWYDAEGRWVQMKFKGGDGSTIEFRCRKCFPSQSASAS